MLKVPNIPVTPVSMNVLFLLFLFVCLFSLFLLADVAYGFLAALDSNRGKFLNSLLLSCVPNVEHHFALLVGIKLVTSNERLARKI